LRGFSSATSHTVAAPESIASRLSASERSMSGGSAASSGTAPFPPTRSRQGSIERAAGFA
jgi:hypothetical protein